MNGLVENALQQQNELKALLANDSLTAEQKAAVKEALTALSSVDIVTNGKADGEYDKDGKADLAAGLASIKAATDTKSKEQNLYNGAAALDTTAQTMSGYAAQLRGSATQLLDGEKLYVTQLLRSAPILQSFQRVARHLQRTTRS